VLKLSYPGLSLLLGGCALAGFGLWKITVSSVVLSPAIKKTETGSAPANSSCELALLPHKGIEQIDREIRQLQHEARTATKRGETIKRLGWAFITKARLSYDPGYYRLAEQCSFCVQSENANDPDAFLLQGHILDTLHKFKEAELVARKLVTIRNEALDHGLLGDVLMEQGRLDEAVVSYQKMINLRPDLQSYTRVANIRWLKGDLQGATAVMQMAVTGGSPREPEPTAWAYTRLGIYEFQAGNTEAAAKSAGIALQFAQNYAAALVLRGRILLAQGKADVFTMDAIAWTLRANGRLDEARDYSQRSLKEGTQDARLFYHAASIAMALGNHSSACELFRRAEQSKQTLMPSERDDLNRQFAALSERDETPLSLAATKPKNKK
jgi:tetratricopeptide (TPR) repeat protein